MTFSTDVLLIMTTLTTYILVCASLVYLLVNALVQRRYQDKYNKSIARKKNVIGAVTILGTMALKVLVFQILELRAGYNMMCIAGIGLNFIVLAVCVVFIVVTAMETGKMVKVAKAIGCR